MTSVTTAQAGVYTATYTNPSGCKSTQKFSIAVNASTSIRIGSSRGPRGDQRIQLYVGGNLGFQPYDGNSVVRISDIRGRPVFQANLTDGDLKIPGLGSGLYVVDLSRAGVLLDRKSFVLE